MLANPRMLSTSPPEQPANWQDCPRCDAGETGPGEVCTACGGRAPEEIGIWDVTPAEYFADTSCVSNSMLKVFSESVPRYHARFVAKTLPPEPESDALRLGSALHAMLLRPKGDLVVQPKFDRRKPEQKAASLAFEAANKGKIIVEPDELELLHGLVAGINANPTTAGLIRESGIAETPIRWRDESTGLWCKGMPDLVTSDFILDLKTIDRLENWPRAVANYGYHRQQAFYQSGDEHVSRHFGHHDRTKDFVFVVVEKTAPYEAAAFTLSADAVDQGRAENLGALTELAERVKKNDWRSRYYQRIQVTSLPRWAMKGA